MADLPDNAQPASWYLRAGRVAGAGLTGAAVGAWGAGIWHAGWEAGRTACQGGGFCIPLRSAVGAVLGVGAVICAVVFLGFLLFHVRPKRLTIPVGCILAAMLIFAVGAGIPGDIPPAPWTAALAVGAGLASLALAVDSGRAQVAGLVAIVVVVAGAFALPRVTPTQVEAVSIGYSPASTSALVQAATDLRPATAAALAGLGP